MDSRLLKPGDSSDETVWPQSMPGPDEKKFLSITVNEDCEVVWALHGEFFGGTIVNRVEMLKVVGIKLIEFLHPSLFRTHLSPRVGTHII